MGKHKQQPVEGSPAAAEEPPQKACCDHNSKSASRSSFLTLLMVIGITYVALRFVWPSVNSVHFTVTTDSVKFHANETANIKSITPHLHSLSRVLQKREIVKADISFALCYSLSAEDVDDFLPSSLGHVKDLKLNFGNTNIQDAGTEYIVNLLPISLEKLDISLDSIKGSSQLGRIVGTGISRLSHLKHLRLSFILSDLKDEGVIGLLEGLSHLKQLQNLTLVLIANELTADSSEAIKSFLQGMTQLTVLDLNLFTNSFQADGAKNIADGISTLTNLKKLDLDFYFNNLTEVGTEHISKALVNLQELNSLRVNLDFNYIKNEGAKAFGKAL
jgi:hypothetical protein